MFIAGLTDERPFGAVVHDVSEEMRCLRDIQSRNRRFARNPLSQYFLADLLAPLEPSEFRAAAHLPAEWQSVIDELKGLIERAIDRLWSSLEIVHRVGFDWRNPELPLVEQYDFPAWAQKAATGLLTWSYNIFKRGGDANAADRYLIDIAHSYVDHSRRFSDEQMYTCMAIIEAAKALRLLGDVVANTDADDGVFFWAKHMRTMDVESSAIRRKMYGAEVDKKIADALPDYLAPSVVTIMDYRIRAERLMLLGDALAAGMLSPDAARTLADEVAKNQAEIRHRRDIHRKNVKAATAATRFLTDERVKEICEAAQARQRDFPHELKKTLYGELASNFGVSVDTIKRALGKK